MTSQERIARAEKNSLNNWKPREGDMSMAEWMEARKMLSGSVIHRYTPDMNITFSRK